MFQQLAAIFRPDFLTHLKNDPKGGFWFWFKWMALLAILGTILGAFLIPKAVEKGSEYIVSELEKQYPDYENFSMELTDGQLTTTAPEPLVLTLGEPDHDDEDAGDNAFQLIIDTQGVEYTEESINGVENVLLVTGSRAIANEETSAFMNRQNELKFANMDDFSLSWSEISEMAETIKTNVGRVVLIPLFIFLCLFVPLVLLVPLFAATVLGWLVAKITRKEMPLGTVWQAMLHYGIIGIGLMLLVGAIGFELSLIWPCLALFVWHLFQMKTAADAPSETTENQEH